MRRTATIAAAKKPRQCSFCDARPTRMVSDDNDIFDCCAGCKVAWDADQGFCSPLSTPNQPKGKPHE